MLIWIRDYTLVAVEECDCPGNCGGKRWTVTCAECGASDRIGLSVEQDGHDLAREWIKAHSIAAHRA